MFSIDWPIVSAARQSPGLASRVSWKTTVVVGPVIAGKSWASASMARWVSVPGSVLCCTNTPPCMMPRTPAPRIAATHSSKTVRRRRAQRRPSASRKPAMFAANTHHCRFATDAILQSW
jgi:hypothetical protein